uniref:TNFR-Cys domain-containing protein n=1 Tax=Myripristis murdjan TaxID=586833 RepID=A0A667ZCV8_9TELE
MDLLHGVLLTEVPTYQHQDPLTGELLTCNKCEPGTHMSVHCTATSPTKCVPCKAEHYTGLWNYLNRCLYCSTYCGENQEVEKECSPVNNRVCRCKQGFYSKDDFCIGHKECGIGHGVITNGTSQMDTVCEKCADGFFSDSSSALEPCVKQQDCASSGQVVLLPGSAYHDTMCGSCDDLKDEVKILRAFLPRFFAFHRMRVVKMRKLVARDRSPLLDQITAWLAQAPEEQLRKLPQMLRALQLSSLADKLEGRFNEIQQQAAQCNHHMFPQC